jgi:hypothetical protein
MRKIWLALMFLLVITLRVQFPFVIAAQVHGGEDAETTAIRRVVDLYMSADAEKIRSAFYPVANLYTSTAQTDLRIIPLEQFLANVAKGAASGAARPKISIDFIDRAGNTAVVKLTELSDAATVTDYFSLVRSNAGWKVVSKTFDVGRRVETSSTAPPKNEHAPDQNHCENSDIRAFDFMVGDWISSTSELMIDVGAHGEGVNHIEKVLGGCVLLQHRQEARDGKQLFDAYAIFAFDATRSEMRLFIVDDGHAQVYEGIWENGGWAFYRERTSDTGEIWLLRVRYVPIGKGITQTVELSKNRGKTWEKASMTTYEPKP